MKLLRLNPKKNKAQAIVEFALVLPILLLVVYGLIEAGRFVFIVSSVNNATRQAARYGSTSGVSSNGVPRFQDCAEIRAAAQSADFLNAFEDTDITITYDHGPGTSSFDTCNGTTDAGVIAQTEDRVIVTIDYNYDAIVPAIVPFISRVMEAESSRTLLLTISVPPPKEPTVTLITSDQPDPSEIGKLVTVVVAVTADKTIPTGTVTISGADENCTVTLSGGTGSCTVRFTSIGTRALYASYNGDADHETSTSEPENHTVNPAATTTRIISDTPEPSLPNQSVNVRVEVTSEWPNPSGIVSITGADSNCTINLSSTADPKVWEGNCNVTFTSIGTKIIYANYSGDAEHDISNDDENHVVVPPGVTTTTITADTPDPSQVGQSVTVYVTVTGTSTTPTGTVEITGADSNCTITLSGGFGDCTVVFNSLGPKTLIATYGGDANNQGSSDNENHTVALPATTTTFTNFSPASPSQAGQPVTITVTVTGGSTTPTGNVVITSSEGNFCTVTLSGGAGSCSGTFTSAGSKTLTATYSGDGTHATSNATATYITTTPPVTGCNTVSLSLLKMVSGQLQISITNPTGVTLQTSNLTVTWNHDNGHQTGSDKTLQLVNANLGSVFWNTATPYEPGPTYTIPATFPAFIPTGTSTLSFSFQQTFDRWDNTEAVTINLLNPGCENVTLYQNQH